MPRICKSIIGALVAAGLTAGCAASLVPAPDLGGLYNRAAQGGDATRNPVIVVPGIGGSKLMDRDTGRVVCGAFAGTYANPSRPDGARLVALPMAEGRPLAELRDAVEPTGVLDRVRVTLLGLPIEPQAYLYILRTLGVGGYRDETLGRMGQLDFAWSSVTFLFSDHLALTQDLGFTDNLLFRLLDSQRPVTPGAAVRGQP